MDDDYNKRLKKREMLSEAFNMIFGMVSDEEIDTDMFNEELDFFLDRLVEEDYFGTESKSINNYIRLLEDGQEVTRVEQEKQAC